MTEYIQWQKFRINTKQEILNFKSKIVQEITLIDYNQHCLIQRILLGCNYEDAISDIIEIWHLVNEYYLEVLWLNLLFLNLRKKICSDY